MSTLSSTFSKSEDGWANRMRLRFRRLVAVEPGEMRVLFWSFAYFFALLCSYYIIRPMRDEMGIAGGIDKLQWMFTGTFLAMLAAVPLFGWVAKRFPVRQFLPYVYYFFIANLILFFVLFKTDLTHAYVARAFFIWASVFNLFIVSVFWSFMTDIFDNDQARRLFGVIAAGGTAGALTGPVLTAALVNPLGPANMLLISVGFLAVAVWCIHRIVAWKKSTNIYSSQDVALRPEKPVSDKEQAIGGGIFAGMKPAREMLYVVLGKEEKYKAKNFIDTVVYRGGDAVSAWAYAGLQTAGISLGGIAWVAVPLAAMWAWISFKLGKRQTAMATKTVSS